MTEPGIGGWPERRQRQRPPPIPATGLGRQLGWWIRTLAPYLGSILVIGVVDAVTPPPVFAGTLLVVPILGASRSDAPRTVHLVFVLAMAALLLSMAVALSAGHTAEIWLPSRILELIALPGATFLALVLQRQRIDARLARNRATRAREVAEILAGLVAHDLRAPIVTTLQTLDLLDREADAAARLGFIEELRGRLKRSLLVSDATLSAAQASLGRTADREHGVSSTDLARSIQQLVVAFAPDAAGRGKEIEVSFGTALAGKALVNTVALIQALTIVTDNAVRYAVPGVIRVRVEQPPGAVEVTVADEGPGLAAAVSSEGTRSGLDLCRALLQAVGGDLAIVRDGPDGTAFRIRLPDHASGAVAG